jgi:uncharacterized RDD family membrane protein YckC
MTPAHATPLARDPRDFITEDALHVAPSLLGLPLAGPWRRGAAFAVDLILVAILSKAPGILLAFAAVLVLFRVSSGRAATAGRLRRSARLAFRAAGAIVLFVAVAKGAGAVVDRIETRVIPAIEGDAKPVAEGTGEATLTLEGSEGMKMAGALLTFRSSRDEAQARERAERLVSSMRAQGVGDEDIRSAVTGLAEDVEGKPWLRAAADSVVSHLGESATASPTEDSAAAPDSLALMHERIREMEREKRSLASQLREAGEHEEERGLVARASTLIQEDLGLGLGWMGLYFTAAVALWQGRTPGKRLFHIRVVRLNGKPIGWWAAFERFGGYAAGLATGLLGFAQIFWDKNRQATHDKICETAVVRD